MPDDYKDVQTYVMNITSESGKEAYSGSVDPFCDYSASALPTADPCAAKIPSDEAKKISATATPKACHADKPVVTCPADSGAGALATGSLVCLCIILILSISVSILDCIPKD